MSTTGARRRRRRWWPAVAVLVAAALLVAMLSGLDALKRVDKAVTEISYPLRYDDIIRQQARAKNIDPALIAAVIYAESGFIAGRTSSAGAEGLMQITPETARDIARRSGGTAFTIEDLATPQINISYGSYLLRELLDRYDGDVDAALAAYNAGPGNADKWGGSQLKADQIPFPETRAYVEKVLEAQIQYRERYNKELGPAP
ncbi:MAG: lytic transglycosylase domain-containing protein [Solirubrobacteraceae bacterium]|nr:lytic transglycosylase domain-containing protein [Solirubrobacteraceae bacterium]MDP5034173.1 lytic transglycosylase domain-containing protein [Solirubrobacteraceae bacterium]